MTDQMPEATLEQLPMSQIVRGENDRTLFEEGPLRELAASLAESGLQQAILVRPYQDPARPDVRYQIMAGERRFRAAQILKWPTIKAVVEAKSDEDASTTMLIENLQRKDLSPMEEAKAFKRRMDQFGWDRLEVARRAGVHEGTVRHRLALLDLCPEAQQFLERGYLPVSHAVEMAMVDHARQRLALQAFRANRTPPMKEFKALIRELRGTAEEAALFEAADYFLARQEVSENTGSAEGGGAGTLCDRTMQARILPSTAPTVGAALEECMAKLAAQNRPEDALLVGTIYDYLVRQRLACVPAVRRLPAAMLAAQPAPAAQPAKNGDPA